MNPLMLGLLTIIVAVLDAFQGQQQFIGMRAGFAAKVATVAGQRCARGRQNSTVERQHVFHRAERT